MIINRIRSLIARYDRRRDSNRQLRFDEPHCTGGDSEVTLTVEQAIAWSKKTHPESSDDIALLDFICIHWAWYK